VVLAATIVGFGLWYRLLSRYDSSVVAPFALLVPVFGLVAAWLFAGEDPTAGELSGTALTVAGLAVLARSWRISPRLVSRT
jgi:O-acetylserine/cysteine efflux transporter